MFVLVLTISANCQANCNLQESIFSEKQTRSSLISSITYLYLKLVKLGAVGPLPTPVSYAYAKELGILNERWTIRDPVRGEGTFFFARIFLTFYGVKAVQNYFSTYFVYSMWLQ